jgi:Arc/MetJ family transcription regulator
VALVAPVARHGRSLTRPASRCGGASSTTSVSGVHDVHIRRRTTLEIWEELLERAKRVLDCTTMRAPVEEALRRVAELGEEEAGRRARRRGYLEELGGRADLAVLRSEEMWR